MLDIIKYPDYPPLKSLNWCKIKFSGGTRPRFSHHDKIWKKILDTGLVKTIVEVGTFVGYTACLMAGCSNVEKVYTVDNWLFTLHRSENPQEQFFSNVLGCGLENKIIPIKGTSWEVGKQFKKLGIKVDLVYIDAHHKGESVRKDLNAWYGVGKFICGDDYTIIHHKALIEEVNKFAKKINCEVKNIGKFWWFEDFIHPQTIIESQ